MNHLLWADAVLPVLVVTTLVVAGVLLVYWILEDL